MGVRVPRITLNADFGDESAFGELSLLSVGYGLHQAWVYATMFGTASVFGPMPCFQGIYGSSVTIPYLISTIVYVFAMLLIAATDQRFLKLYTSRKLLCIGAALSCAGSLLLLAVPFFGTPLAETASGIMTGIGSAILIVYWGTAFARTDSASIVLNTAIAISIAIGLFATVLHYAPFPVSAIAIACVPLLELAILLKKTPQPFHERDEVPIFKPLPINCGAAKGMEALEQGAAESAERRERAADDPAAEGEASALADASSAAVAATAIRGEAEAASCEVPASADNAAADRAAREDGEGTTGAEPTGAANGSENAAVAQFAGTANGNNLVADSTATPSALTTARERQATQPTPEAIAEARFAKPGEPARGGGRFRGKCETVANTFLLSRRETEILFFLAKGHNAAYIQEKLYISEGTAKTHIRHIYRKCDIHKQQDLMRMVEDAQPTE